MLTQKEFEAMLQRDLNRAKLNQKTFAHEFVLRGEQLSNVTITHWKQQGYIPGSRLPMALDILGKDSELARVPMAIWHALWANSKAKEKEKEFVLTSSPLAALGPAPVREGERMQALRSLVPSLAARVQRHMPSEFWGNFNPPLEDRDRRHIPTYSRNGQVVQLVQVRPGTVSRTLLMAAIFKLAVIKAVFTYEAVRSHLVLVVLGEPIHPEDASMDSRMRARLFSTEQRDDMIAEYAYDAQALNVQLRVVDSPEEAAIFLLDWATKTISEPLDEDGVEELDPDEEF